MTGRIASPMKKRQHRRKMGQGARHALPLFPLTLQTEPRNEPAENTEAFTQGASGIRAEYPVANPGIPASLLSRGEERCRRSSGAEISRGYGRHDPSAAVEPEALTRTPFSRQSEQSAHHALPFFVARSPIAWREAMPDSIITRSRNLVPFLLPALRFGCGTLYAGTAFSVAANQNWDSSRRMRCAINGGSKLCMVRPCHAQVRRLSATSLRSTWQGGGNPLRCILPLCRPRRPVKTLPVSTPSGSRVATALRSWAVYP